MHGAPEWFVAILFVLSHPAFWIALTAAAVAVIALVVRAMVKAMRRSAQQRDRK